MTAFRFLSRDDLVLAGARDWSASIADLSKVLRLFRDGQAQMAAECVLPTGPDPREKAYSLPATVGGIYAASGVKWTQHRVAAALPGEESISSMTLLFDLETNRPLGIVKSAYLTRIRTAAVSAAVVECLFPDGPRNVAVLGAGAQAEIHLEMLAACYPAIETVRIWNRSGKSLGSLGRNLAVPFPVERHRVIEDALKEADLVLCTTSSPEPILDDRAVASGRAIFQIGYNEASFDVIDASDCILVDLWGEFAQTSAKSLFQMHRAGRFDPGRVYADLPGLLLDSRRPEPGESVYFSGFGLNIFDIALAARLVHQAEALNIGTVLNQ